MAMTPEQKQQLNEAIIKRIADLKENIKSLKETSKPVEPDRALGRLTRMDAIQIQNMQEANLEVAKQNLEKLEKAHEHLDDENFGMCQYCKKMIGFERILALPETNKCIECAEKYGG